MYTLEALRTRRTDDRLLVPRQTSTPNFCRTPQMHMTQPVSDNLTADTVPLTCQESLNDSDIYKILVNDPASWKAFRTLAAYLEAEGDVEAARECYLGRLPEHVQTRFFNDNATLLTANDIHCEVFPAHPPTSRKPSSVSIQNTPRLKRYRERDLVSNSTSVVTFDNASLWFDGYNTIVSNKQGEIDKATVAGNLAPALHAARQVEPVKLNGQVVLMGTKGSNNYYHWMTDILPKFSVLEKAGIQTSGETRYVFTNITAKFQKETLKDFGINDNQLFKTNSQGSHIVADELVVPQMSNTMGFTMGDWLPEYMKKRYSLESTTSQFRKILVSRNSEASHGRGIHNLHEFNQYFLERGYEIISPENYSVAEQARLFSEASRVAGPHGAGLTNLLFCQPGTTVYEFYGEHLAPCYWAISELSGLDYKNMNCSGLKSGAGSDLDLAKTLSSRRSCSFGIDLSVLDAAYI